VGYLGRGGVAEILATTRLLRAAGFLEVDHHAAREHRRVEP
jgi:hypothetical protein